MPDPLQLASNLLSPASFLRDKLATPDGELGALGRQIKQSAKMFCDGLRANPGIQDLPTVQRSYGDEVCKDYWEEGNNTGPSLSAPFSGGQCPKAYNVTTSYFRSGQTNVQTATFMGPIGGLTTTIVPTPPGGGISDWRITLQTGSGPTNIASGGYFGGGDEPSGAKITNIVPLDGVDNCGNPPPVFTPGVGPTYTWGNPVVISPSPLLPAIEIKVNPPEVTDDGGFNIPVSINNEVEINIGYSSESANQAPLETMEGQPIDSQNPPAGIDPGNVGPGDLPPPPDGFEYVGVAVKFISIPQFYGVIVGTPPNNIFPDIVGNLRLRLRSGNHFYLGERYDVRENNFSRVSDVNGVDVVGWTANFRPGFVPIYTPILRTIRS